jgi:hypothetical protein
MKVGETRAIFKSFFSMVCVALIGAFALTRQAQRNRQGDDRRSGLENPAQACYSGPGRRTVMRRPACRLPANLRCAIPWDFIQEPFKSLTSHGYFATIFVA